MFTQFFFYFFIFRAVSSFHAFQSKFYGVQSEKCHRTYNFLHTERKTTSCKASNSKKLFLLRDTQIIIKKRVKMDDITVEVCGENGAWYKVCTILSKINNTIFFDKKVQFIMMPNIFHPQLLLMH